MAVPDYRRTSFEVSPFRAVHHGPLMGLFISIDFLIIVVSSIVSAFIYHEIGFGTSGDLNLYVGVGVIVGSTFVVTGYLQGIYQTSTILVMSVQVRKVALNWLLALTALAVATFAFKATSVLSRGTIVSFSIIGLFALSTHRLIWRYAMPSALAKAHLRDRRVMLLSFSPVDFTASQFQELRKSGFAVSRYFVVSKPIEGQSWGDEVKRIVEQARAAEIEEILLAINFEELGSLPPLLDLLRSAPLPVRLLPDRLIADLATRKVISVGRSIAIELQRPPLTLSERIQKRCLDIVLASAGLLALSPLLLITAMLVRFSSTGPAIFRQSRRGFNGKPFQIYKFRSMYLHNEDANVQQASRGDARVTPIGRILRRTSIDELPQLVNVLRGNMSLVGPRPHAVAHDNYYDKLIDNYAFRHHVRPGLTGWAQVHGFRGETPTIETMQKRIEYDVAYVNNWSIWLDIRIILTTAVSMLLQDAY